MKALGFDQKAQGFDQTVGASDDAFGRRFFADNVYDRLMAYDAEWSVRVALLGDWGSGKTNIAEWVEGRARKEGHVVGWIYPWRVNTSKDVAIALTLTVLRALEEAGISLSVKGQLQKSLTESLEFIKRFKGLHAFAEVGFSLFEDANAFDAEFAKPIADRLAQVNKRLLVIIDDLDRCEPAFLAPLMLFMRTALNIRGFSFLAPFDSDVVAKTLLASNRAWSSADRFLEKVFDYRIPIPDLTIEQKTRFLISELAKEQLYPNDSDVSPAATLLPGTPRAIKALAREIGTARAEIERRSSDELSWPLLVFATMLRATSLEFFRAYRREVVDTVVEEESWQRTSELDSIWKLVGEPDPATQGRVSQLVKALENAAATAGIGQLRRTLHFTDEHEPVTRMEFERFIARWLDLDLAQALAQLPIWQTRSPAEVGAHLAWHAISGYQRVLEQISHTVPDSLRDERLNLVRKGQCHLDLGMELLALIGDAHADHRFDLFVRLLATERNSDRAFPDTANLHSSTLQLLQQLCAAARGDWARYDDCISHTLSLNHGNVEWNVEVSTALRQPMKEIARAELLRRLQLTNGLDGIFEPPSHFGLMAQIFLDPNDAFWNEKNAPAILNAGTIRSVIRENAGSAFRWILPYVSPAGGSGWELMRMHMESRPPYSVEGLIARFLRSEAQLRIVWNAYASGLRGDAEVEEMRESLARLGAPPAAIDIYSE